MAFNSKINLSNSKVYQGNGEKLYLSGDTSIAAVGDLRYATHPTFTDPTQIVDKKYVDDTAVSATGSTVYNPPLLSPAAVAVGGITIGYVLTGKTSNEIIQDLLFPELCGTLTAPSTSIALSVNGTCEVGYVIPTQTVTATFNRGCINPQYCSTSDKRSGCVNAYCWTGAQMPSGLQSCVISPVSLNATSYSVVAGANTWTVYSCFDAGSSAVSNKGNQFAAGLAAGATSAPSATVTGIYPYFYGKVVDSGSRPAVTNALVTGGTKVVANVTNPTTVSFNAASNEYSWFAIPAACSSRGCWYVNALDNGKMNTGPADKYPDQCILSINSACWSGISYKVYMSGTVGAIAAPMAFCI
jgi:hypothetical protein